jgi:hypothetical protein
VSARDALISMSENDEEERGQLVDCGEIQSCKCKMLSTTVECTMLRSI